MLYPKKKGFLPFKSSQNGQIFLIVVLVVIVTSTIGLSLASRSITSIRTSTEEADSQKALAAAEAGIERAIQGSTLSIGEGILIGNFSSNNADYRVDVEGVQDSSFLINGGNVIPKDEGADVWFADHDEEGNVDNSSAMSPKFVHLYWGSPSEICGTSTAPAALQVVVITRSPSSLNDIKSYRYAFDSCSSRRAENNFKQAESGSFTVAGISGVTFGVRTPEDGANKDLSSVGDIVLMRVIPLYKDAVIGVSACNRAGNNCTSLSSQGYKISSIGESGAANRKLTVFKGYPQIYLPYLSYGLFVAN